jgi:hypothetical protein
MDGKRVKYQILGHEYVLQDQIAQAAKFVLSAKGLIDSAVKSSPAASIAWAGVCIILPVLTNPSTADKANRDGFTCVTTRMCYYTELEPLLLSTSAENLIVARKEHIIDLYKYILEFQLRSVLRFYRCSFRNFGRDLFQSKTWEDMQNAIKGLENSVRQDFKQIHDWESIKKLESLNTQAEKSSASMKQLLSLAEKQVGVLTEQLQVQQKIAQRMFSQDEEKCHQLFRLTDESNESYETYKSRIEERLSGTCQWFLDHENFQKWLEQDSGLLMVSADPGCGKSVLAKYLIDHRLPRSATICYFFFKDPYQITIRQALCALLHQLFSYKPSLIRNAMPEYSKNGSELSKVTTSLWSILEKASIDPEAGPVIFVLDALDECAESDFRDLVSMLKRQFHEQNTQFGKVKFLLTCRPYGDIVSEFRELVDAFPYIRIPGEDEDESKTISQEVNCVIKHRVDQLAKEKRLTVEIKDHLEQLQQHLLKIPHRTYLWVYLVFDFLKSFPRLQISQGVLPTHTRRFLANPKMIRWFEKPCVSSWQRIGLLP